MTWHRKTEGGGNVHIVRNDLGVEGIKKTHQLRKGETIEQCQKLLSALRTAHSEGAAIPNIFDGDVEKDGYWMVMERIPLQHAGLVFKPSSHGANSAELYGSIRHLLVQILRTLEILHRYEIIHQDIKPENILCDPVSQEYFLIDFGESKTKEYYLDPPDTIPGRNSIYAPTEYRTPESWDLYSLGLTAAVLLTHTKFSRVVNPAEVSTKRLSIFQKLKQMPGLPTDIRQVLDRTLAVDVREQPVSARELLDILEPPPPERTLSFLQKLTLVVLLLVAMTSLTYFSFFNNASGVDNIPAQPLDKVVTDTNVQVQPGEQRSGQDNTQAEKPGNIAGKRTPVLHIEHPTAGQFCAEINTVRGKAMPGSRVEVFVSEKKDGGRTWYAQKAAISRQDSTWETAVHIGGNKTEHGTEFEIVVITGLSDTIAYGTQVENLPEKGIRNTVVVKCRNIDRQ
ncbi:hypothetical protein KQI65_00480 [bacterium]|nr:hypothetical protein [bacterium]